jgi:hypothetical protein
LADLGLPAAEIPPLDVKEGTHAYASHTDASLPLYRADIQLTSDIIDNRAAWTYTYCEWMSMRTFSHGNWKSIPLYKQVHLFNAEQAMCGYFNASFWGDEADLAAWGTHFWLIRKRLGRDFTDKLVAYTFIVIKDDDSLWKEADRSDEYLCPYVKRADSIIDSESHNWPIILEVLGRFPRLARQCQ